MSSAPSPLVRLRPATDADLGEMAAIHKASYGPGHFLALLPATTISEYYRLFLGDGSRIVIAELESSGGAVPSLTGFAVFGENIEPRIRIFKRQQRLAILLTALSHPIVSARKVVQRLLDGSGASTPHRPAAWLLLSIAVRGTRRGTGSVLLQEMLRQAASNGQERFGLYVRHSNVGAINAYLRAGFRILASLSDQYYMEIALRPLASSDTA